MEAATYLGPQTGSVCRRTEVEEGVEMLDVDPLGDLLQPVSAQRGGADHQGLASQALVVAGQHADGLQSLAQPLQSNMGGEI